MIVRQFIFGRWISKLLCLLLVSVVVMSILAVTTIAEDGGRVLAINDMQHEDSGGIISNFYGSLRKVAETDDIVMYYRSDNYAIIVEDKRNGFLWSSAVDMNSYGIENVNNRILSRMKSMFEFKYTNITNNKFATVAVDYTVHTPEVILETTHNGVNMLYKFDKLGISIQLKIFIEENTLIVQIPADRILEEGDYHILSIDLMPFLGASSNEEEGYIFYPDGCGALFRFDDKTGKKASKSIYYIYGSDSLNLDVYQYNKVNKIKTAMLPVFGIKKGDTAAFIAAVTKGEFDTAIGFSPSSFSNIHLNRISPEFTYRRTYEDLRDNPNIPPRIENEMNKVDREVKYFFLANENADYSGMANEYRRYLVDTEKITRKSSNYTKLDNSSNSIPMSLDLFMGIKEERILFDKFVRATTFEQAEEILKEFSSKGVDNIHVKLMGWGAKGYGEYPVFSSPNKSLGGKEGLLNLAELSKKNGYQLYLDTNVTDANKDVGGFSVRYDTVYLKNGLIAVDSLNKKLLLNPAVSLDRFKNQFISEIRGFGINGLCIEKIGGQVYRDYNEKSPLTREKTAMLWQEILEETQNQLGNCSVEGGNLYVLKHVDRLFEIPVEDSGNIVTTEAIPFYQMIVHGYIPYSSDPGNLFYDYQSQKLKWIEYGCMPYFKLTYSKSDVLKYTEYNSLFSSYYKDWLDIAAQTYREFNERLGDIWNKEMVKHEKMRNGLFKVVYDDGTKIYINYNSVKVFVDGYEINPIEYLVIDREGSVK